ncbi:MAG TPA: PAS domain-containing protein, partial [Chthoniobacterales bacterium]
MAALLLIALAGFSLFLSPRAILIWTVVFSIPVTASVLGVADVLSLPPGATFLRIASFFCAGGMAGLISAYRLHLSAEVGNFIKIFDALPVPLVVSDVDGEIQFANGACCELLRLPLEQVTASSYFSLFSDSQNRGREISRYLELFEDETSQSHVVLAIQLAQGSIRRLATCFVVKIRAKPYLVT